MDDGPGWFVIALLAIGCVVLLLLVGWVVYCIIRFVIGMIQSARLFRQHPERKFLHPEFRELTGQFGCWSGYVDVGNEEIQFTVDGSEFEPDQRMLERVRELLPRLRELERVAVQFLNQSESFQEYLAEAQTHNPTIRDAEFSLAGLTVLADDVTDCFSLEFFRHADDYGIWRVDFENGKPVADGFDD